MTTVTAPVERDERVVRTGLLRRLLGRPELGAAVGAIAVFTFFAVYTDQFATGRGIGNALDPAATLGIMAVVVALLMIGGEFDLSAGVMTASSGLLIAILTTKAGFDVWLALPLALLVGAMTVLRLRSVQANQGIGDEFAFIIAAVIGGCLLTGGYGSAIGATIGAFIFGMARQGIVFAGWDSDWFQAFLGVLLLLATMLNHFVRRRAEVAKR